MRLSAAQTDRAVGAVLASAAGDALGAGYEFGTADVGPEGPRMIGGGLGGFAPGEWTDDTTMAWAVLDVAASGADLRSEPALTAIAAHFRDWYDTAPKDIGNQTRAVLGRVGPAPTGATLTAEAARLHERTGHTAGNGSLMRTGPVALAHLDDRVAVAQAAAAVGALTHADPVAVQACVLWSLAVRHAVLTAELDLRGGLDLLAPEAREQWQTWIEEAETRPPSTFRPNGYVVTAFQAAWAAISQTPVPAQQPCRHLADALDTAIRIGHDTDTVAAIAGSLLGARWGASAVPASWRRVLHGYPGISGDDLERSAVLAARGGRRLRYGWPDVDRIDYADAQLGRPALARHPFDDGVWLAGATALDALSSGPLADVDAVVSLCLLGREQVPGDVELVEQIGFRLIDEADPASNPNLDFVLADAAGCVADLRADGRTVLLHCVAAHSRTPAVGVAYALLLGVPLAQALPAVCDALPAADPNPGFRAALERLSREGFGAVIDSESSS